MQFWIGRALQLKKFEAGDFDLHEKPCSGWPSWIDDAVVERAISFVLRTSGIAEKVHPAQQTIPDLVGQYVNCFSLTSQRDRIFQ